MMKGLPGGAATADGTCACTAPAENVSATASAAGATPVFNLFNTLRSS
jgi:hypothetical protein